MFFGFLVLLGSLRTWGSDKAPRADDPKVRVFLMPDSHNAMCESRAGPLTDLDQKTAPIRRCRRMRGKILGVPEPYHDLDGHIRTRGDVFDPRLKRCSNQDQVAEREQSGAHADCHQG